VIPGLCRYRASNSVISFTVTFSSRTSTLMPNRSRRKSRLVGQQFFRDAAAGSALAPAQAEGGMARGRAQPGGGVVDRAPVGHRQVMLKEGLLEHVLRLFRRRDQVPGGLQDPGAVGGHGFRGRGLGSCHAGLHSIHGAKPHRHIR
jgi:hypothetical protein